MEQCLKFDNLITSWTILISKEWGNVLLVHVRYPCPVLESVVYLYLKVTGQFYVYHCPSGAYHCTFGQCYIQILGLGLGVVNLCCVRCCHVIYQFLSCHLSILFMLGMVVLLALSGSALFRDAHILSAQTRCADKWHLAVISSARNLYQIHIYSTSLSSTLEEIWFLFIIIIIIITIMCVEKLAVYFLYQWTEHYSLFSDYWKLQGVWTSIPLLYLCRSTMQ